MSIDPTGILVTVCLRDPGDPAINREHPGAQLAVSEHDRSRSSASLDALRACAHPGRTLREFHLSPLTMDGVVFATEGTDPNGVERAVRAFQCACFLIVADGERITAEMLTSRDTPQSKREWVNRIAQRFGVNAIKELGALALRRAEVTSEVVDPYSRLPGAPRLML